MILNKTFDGKCLLVAEDDDGLRDLIVEELESLGAKVFSACNGVEAFALLLKERIDGIISDIRMPGGDGIELLKKVRGNDYAHPSLLFITGYTDLNISDAYELGAENILPKPFDLDFFAKSVLRLLTLKNIQWSLPYETEVPKLSLIRKFKSIQDADKEGEFRLGRGGAFIKLNKDELLELSSTQFLKIDISFDSGEILSLKGYASIKWIRTKLEDDLPLGCGVQFEHLPQTTSDQLNTLVERMMLRSYIPKT